MNTTCLFTAALAAAIALAPPTAHAQWGRPAQPSVAANAWPTAATGRPEGVVNPRVVRGTDAGLLITGCVLLGLGVATSVFGVTMAFTDGDDIWGKAVAPQGIWPSIPGIILIVFAATNFTEDFEPDPTPGRVQVQLFAPGADLGGLSLGARF